MEPSCLCLDINSSMLMMHHPRSNLISMYMSYAFFLLTLYMMSKTLESVSSDAKVSDGIYIYLPNGTILVGEFMMHGSMS